MSDFELKYKITKHRIFIYNNNKGHRECNVLLRKYSTEGLLIYTFYYGFHFLVQFSLILILNFEL